MGLYIWFRMVSHGLEQFRTVSHGLVRSLIRLNWDMASVSVFFKVLKIIHSFHGYTGMARV